MELTGLCHLCGKPGVLSTCRLCGKLVCRNCFHTQHDVCRICAPSR